MESQAPLTNQVVRPIFSPPMIAEALSVQSTSFDLRTLAFNNLRASAAAPAFSRSSFAAGSAAQARFSASRLKSGHGSPPMRYGRYVL
jgi:hypothetical protein